MFKRLISLCLSMFLLTTIVFENASIANAATSKTDTYIKSYQDNYPEYLKHDKVLADTFLKNYNNSEAQALVARAIWYMENGYMIYGHSKYWDTGFIDCSNFVSLVYKDLGYKITSAAKNYDQVGEKVAGVYSRKISGSSKYELVGTENLKPGDIFTFWKKSNDGKETYIGHVALYMGKINGQPAIIQTNTERPTAIGIRTDFRYWYGEHFLEARRVLDNNSQAPKKEWQASAPIIPALYQLPPQKPVVMPADIFMSNKGINDTNTNNTSDTKEIAPSPTPEPVPPESNPTEKEVANKTDSIDKKNSSAENKAADTKNPPATGSSSASRSENNNYPGNIDAHMASFTDITGHWAEDNIKQLQKAQLISGYPDGTFRADNTITRAEFVTLLVKAFNLKLQPSQDFNDTGFHWAHDYIETARAHGIVSGYSDNYFGVNEPITREEMAVMIIKAAQIENNPHDNPARIFADSSQISNWAQDAVLIANQQDIIAGYPDETFQPQNVTSRAEAVTVIVKTLPAKI